MSIRQIIHAIANPDQPGEAPVTDQRNLLKTSFWGSKRFLLVLGFVAMIILIPTVLRGEVLGPIAWVLCFYIVGETVTKSIETVMNGLIKREEVVQDVKYEQLKASQPKQ